MPTAPEPNSDEPTTPEATWPGPATPAESTALFDPPTWSDELPTPPDGSPAVEWPDDEPTERTPAARSATATAATRWNLSSTWAPSTPAPATERWASVPPDGADLVPVIAASSTLRSVPTTAVLAAKRLGPAGAPPRGSTASATITEEPPEPRPRPVWPWLGAAVLAVLFALSMGFRHTRSVASAPVTNPAPSSTVTQPTAGEPMPAAPDDTVAPGPAPSAAVAAAPPARRNTDRGTTAAGTDANRAPGTSSPLGGATTPTPVAQRPPTTTQPSSPAPSTGPGQPPPPRAGQPCTPHGATTLTSSGDLLFCVAGGDGKDRWQGL